MKMIIEVCGGVVTNIIATDEVSIYIIDHDNMKVEEGAVEEAKKAQQPDYICDENNLLIHLDEMLEDYKEYEGVKSCLK